MLELEQNRAIGVNVGGRANTNAGYSAPSTRSPSDVHRESQIGIAVMQLDAAANDLAMALSVLGTRLDPVRIQIPMDTSDNSIAEHRSPLGNDLFNILDRVQRQTSYVNTLIQTLTI